MKRMMTNRISPQTTDHQQITQRQSTGFTLVELLVVITIIGMLVALLLPAVQAARATAQKNACLNNVKQLGTATISYESSKGKLPGYVQNVKRSDGSLLEIVDGSLNSSMYGSYTGSSPTTEAGRVSFIGVLLPELERQDIWDRVVNGQDFPLANSNPIQKLAVVECPVDNDLTSQPNSAGSSYIGNSGGWDLVSGGRPGANLGDIPENGVLQNLVLQPRNTMRSSKIRDGATSTLLFSENIHKFVENNSNQSAYSWMGVRPTSQNPYGEQQFGFTWVPSLTPGTVNNLTSDIYQAGISQEGINVAAIPTDYPAYARPSSNHPRGAVNVIFADGHGQSLASDIDYQVYQALLTSNGAKCVDVTDHTNVGSNLGTDPIFTFRTRPPLNEQDYQ